MKLGVNIDHVATLRQLRVVPGMKLEGRASVYPSPVEAAIICQKVGADSVVMHLREDRRHIQDRDLFEVKDNISIKLNLEMSIAPSVVKLAHKLKPHQVTLVPEKRQEKTTEGGLDLFNKTSHIQKHLEALSQKNIQVSFFVDPDIKQIKLAKKMGVHAIELHTGDYANQYLANGKQKELKRLKDAAIFATAVGLKVYAGHGIDYENVEDIQKIHVIEELNIGYSIVTRALWVGFETAVRQMKEKLTP